MTSLSRDETSKGQKTLLTAMLLSLPGPIVTAVSAATSLSTTQIADFLRRSTELVAVIVSWWVYRRLHRNKERSGVEQARLEYLAGLSVGVAMGCSGGVMFIVAALRLSAHSTGDVTMGLVIAVLGLITNTWFYFRYRALALERFDAILIAQQRLYAAKSGVDFCVIAALAAVAIAPSHPVTRYVDTLGSVIITCYLLWTGFRTIRAARLRLQS